MANNDSVFTPIERIANFTKTNLTELEDSALLDATLTPALFNCNNNGTKSDFLNYYPNISGDTLRHLSLENNALSSENAKLKCFIEETVSRFRTASLTSFQDSNVLPNQTELKRQLDERIEAVVKLTNKLAATEFEVRHITKQFSDFKLEHSKILETRDCDIDDLKSQLQTSKLENLRIGEKLSEAIQTNEKLKSYLTGLPTFEEHERLRSSEKQLTEKKDLLKDRVLVLLNKLGDSKRETIQCKENIAELNEKIILLEKTNARLLQNVSCLKMELHPDKCDGELPCDVIARLESEKHDISVELMKYKDLCNNKRQQLEKLKSELYFEKKSAAANSEDFELLMKQASERISELELTVKLLNRSLEEEMASSQELELQLGNVKSRLHDLEQLNIEDRYANTKSQTRSLHAVITKLQKIVTFCHRFSKTRELDNSELVDLDVEDASILESFEKHTISEQIAILRSAVESLHSLVYDQIAADMCKSCIVQ